MECWVALGMFSVSSNSVMITLIISWPGEGAGEEEKSSQLIFLHVFWCRERNFMHALLLNDTGRSLNGASSKMFHIKSLNNPTLNL